MPFPDALFSPYRADNYRADCSFAPSQWETALLRNSVSHWLGENLESALRYYAISDKRSQNYMTANVSASWVVLLRTKKVNNMAADVLAPASPAHWQPRYWLCKQRYVYHLCVCVCEIQNMRYEKQIFDNWEQSFFLAICRHWWHIWYYDNCRFLMNASSYLF